MECIKSSSNVEFDVCCDDGTSHHVIEGILMEVEEDEVILHLGTGRVSVLFAAVDALLTFVTSLGLHDAFCDYMLTSSAEGSNASEGVSQ